MPAVTCTERLQGVGPTHTVSYAGETFAALLQAMAEDYPRLKNYVLDDQGHVRKHVAIFIDGEMVPKSAVLQRILSDNSEIYIMQALSGG